MRGDSSMRVHAAEMAVAAEPASQVFPFSQWGLAGQPNRAFDGLPQAAELQWLP